MAKSFHQLAERTQEARVRSALEAGEKPEAGAVTIYLGLPESEVTAVAEVLDRLAREETGGQDHANGHAGPTEAEREEIRALRGAQGLSLAEIRRRYPHLTAAAVREATAGIEVEPKHGDPSKVTVKGGRKGVTVSRTRPQQPDYNKIPEAQRAAVRAKYERALAVWKNAAEVRAAEKKEPARKPAKAQQPKAKTNGHAKSNGRAIEPPPGFASWDDPKLATKVLTAKTKNGYTIKAIAAELGLPAEERYWHRVSLVCRAAADAKGVKRPHKRS